LGFWNPLLYAHVESAGALNDITQGKNDTTALSGGYSAGPGWDACTGFGSPNGAKLLAALQGLLPPSPGGSAHKQAAKKARRVGRTKRAGRARRR
jgi:hypothetical protein